MLAPLVEDAFSDFVEALSDPLLPESLEPLDPFEPPEPEPAESFLDSDFSADFLDSAPEAAPFERCLS